MWYADTVGLKKVYDRMCEFEKQHGSLWKPAPLLKELAEERQDVRRLRQGQRIVAIDQGPPHHSRFPARARASG